MTKKQVKLKTGSESISVDAFDLKSSMTPVTGEGKKIDLSTFDSVKSKDGHTFYVIGESGGIRISFRMWKEASNHGTTCIGFRMRFGDKLVDGVPTTALDTEFGELVNHMDVWTSSSTLNVGHRSIMGTFDLSAPAWAAGEVVDVSKALNLSALVYAKLATVIHLPLLLIDPDRFDYLWNCLIHVTLADVFKPADPAAKSAMHWGSAQKPLLRVVNGTVMPTIGSTVKVKKPTDGKAYPGGSEVLPTVVPANAVAHPKAFAAPHPKDAAKASGTDPQASESV